MLDRLGVPLEVKFDTGGDGEMVFSGYASVFGGVDKYGDQVVRGAFKATLREARKSGNWPAMLVEHGGAFGGDPVPVGVWTDLAEDEKGLRVEGRLAPTERGREIHALMKMQPRPAINGLSIGYRATDWKMGKGPAEPRRTLKAVDLFEVSLTSRPADDAARVTQVKAAAQIGTIREFEGFLRDAGYSHTRAARIAEGGFKAADPRDEGDEAEIVAALRRSIEILNPRGA